LANQEKEDNKEGDTSSIGEKRKSSGIMERIIQKKGYLILYNLVIKLMNI
jgi:hypothetical protein